MARKDFNVYQGDTYTESVQWLDSGDNVKNLLDYTAKMQVRDTRDNLILDLTDDLEIKTYNEIIITMPTSMFNW